MSPVFDPRILAKAQMSVEAAAEFRKAAQLLIQRDGETGLEIACYIHPDGRILVDAVRGLDLSRIVAEAYANSANHGFWDSPRNKGEMFMLMVCELAEGFEAVRCKETVMSDHIPEFTMEAEEMADEIIRVADYCGGFGINLVAAVKAKMEYNRTRPHMHGDKKA